jgi:hypothetical protein
MRNSKLNVLGTVDEISESGEDRPSGEIDKKRSLRHGLERMFTKQSII